MLSCYAPLMNLLMLIIIFLAICVAGGVIYFAWTMTPGVLNDEEKGETREATGSPDSEPGDK